MKNLQRAGALFVIIAATFLVYWPAQRNGFVWDDTALVLRDPLIRSWRLIPEGFRHFLFIDATASNFYRPLQRLSFTADYALWELLPRGYHLTSIYFHIAAAVALFFLSDKLLATGRGVSGPQEPSVGRTTEDRYDSRSTLLATAVVLIWAIHPLHTSAVTYVAGRADPLAAFFGFSALALGLATLGGRRRTSWATAGATFCFLAALLSKESGGVALLLWFALLGWRGESRRVFLQWAALAALVLLSYGALRFTAEKTPPPRSTAASLAQRPALAARAFAEYARLFAAPITLHMERDVAAGSTGDQSRSAMVRTVAGLGLLAGFFAWFIWARRRAPVAEFGLIAFVISYLPISNLFPLNATIAEHWLYVPSAFLLLAGFVSVREITADYPGLRRLAIALTAAWAFSLGMRTWLRQPDWENARTFITRTIEAGGDSARMHINLGHLESMEGRNDLALQHFSEALKRAPNQPFALLGMATAHLRLGNHPAMRAFLEKAEQLPFVAAEARQLRASLLFHETGRDTIHMLGEAADLLPRNWPTRKRYIAALESRGDTAAAMRELRRFLEREDFRGDSWKMLGNLLDKSRDPERAAAAFEEAARLDVWDTWSRARLEQLRRHSSASEGSPIEQVR